MRLLTLIFTFAVSLATNHDHHDHNHDGHEHDNVFEWAGTFEVGSGTYAWTAQQVNEEYAYASMKLLALEVTEEEHLLGVYNKTIVSHLFEDCMEIGPGEEFGLNSCYKLIFNQDLYTNVFALTIPEDDEEHEHHNDEEEHEHHDDEEEHEHHDDEEEHEHHDHDEEEHEHDHGSGTFIIIFAEHFPTEFENDQYYLKDSHGHDIEPTVEISDSIDEDGGGGGGSRRGRAWHHSMLATFLVVCCTVIGAIIRLPVFWGYDNYDAFVRSDFFTSVVAAFGAGALLACAVYFMFFESVHLVQSRWSEESQATWRFGTMIIAGWAAGAFTQYYFEHAHTPSHEPVRFSDMSEQKTTDDVEKAEQLEVAKAAETSSDSRGIHWGLVFSITAGDWLHNLVDGFVIAQAFLDCSVSKGWTIVAATIYHELAQEISDFAILLNVAGLSVIPALGVNIFTGLSVMIGAAIYMWTKPGVGTQGLLLAFAGGMYTYLATNVAAAQFLKTDLKSSLSKLCVFFCFAIGVIAIGLVLLDHEHCTGGDGGGEDGGHGHAHRI